MSATAFPAHEITPIPKSLYNPLFTHLHSLLDSHYHIIRPPPTAGQTHYSSLALLALPNGNDHSNHSNHSNHSISNPASDQSISSPCDETTPSIPQLLNAISTRSGWCDKGATSYLIPYPTFLSDIPNLPIPSGYWQLDLYLCRDFSEMEWTAFLHSYGDFWRICSGMLGGGLRLDAMGLHTTMPPVVLSRCPTEVLRFMGFCEGEYRGGHWEGEEDMWRYIKGCRFFSGERCLGSEEGVDREGVVRWREFVRGNMEGGEGWTEEGIVKEAVRWFGKEEEFKAASESA
ncbi:hypothetical protein BZA77DRAFT_344726 [Pyronema omphalodes]|nr:hypothetical protein BZA77DRAFT_344726 [Pyronema omphalodes]